VGTGALRSAIGRPSNRPTGVNGGALTRMEAPGERLLTKMWESLVDRGIGSWLRPWQTRRDGRAYTDVRREELLVLAEAERDAADIRSGRKRLGTGDDGTLRALPAPRVAVTVSGTSHPALPSAVEAAGTTMMADAIRKEVNVAKAIMAAEADLIEEEQAPSSRQIDTDWLFRWRDMAGAVSNQELQTLWGRVLAGEVKSPGSFSLRTLDLLKNISQEEAQAIAKLSRFAAENFVYRGDEDLLKAEGVHYGFLLFMQQLGIVSGVEASHLTLIRKSQRVDSFETGIVSNGRVLVVTDPDPKKTFTLYVCQLTDIGRQIIRLGSFEPQEAYLRSLGKHIKEQGFRVRLGRHRYVDDQEGRFFDEVDL
jgi:hypothetical protein